MLQWKWGAFRTLSVELLETVSSSTYDNNSNNVVPNSKALQTYSRSQIIKKFRNDMKIITRFENFISALVTTTSFKTSARTCNQILFIYIGSNVFNENVQTSLWFNLAFDLHSMSSLILLVQPLDKLKRFFRSKPTTYRSYHFITNMGYPKRTKPLIILKADLKVQSVISYRHLRLSSVFKTHRTQQFVGVHSCATW